MINININNLLKNLKFSKYANYNLGWKIKNKNKNNLLLLNNKFDSNKIIDNINQDNLFESYDIYKKFPTYFPEIVDQGDIGSCVQNSISTIYYYLTFKQNNNIKFRISRLYLYYFIQKLYDNFNDDCGSSIEDNLNFLKKNGLMLTNNEKLIINNKFKDTNTLKFKNNSFIIIKNDCSST